MALARMGTPTGQSIRLVTRFLKEEREMNPHSSYLFPHLVKELGSLSDSLSTETSETEQAAQQVYRKCLQVAVLAIRIATEGDDDFNYEPIAIFGENSDTQ